MTTTLYSLVIAALLPVIIQAASAQTVLLNDNFQVSSNSQNINQQLASRQTGSLVAVPVNTVYTAFQGSVQVGNTNTDVGQPGGAANGNLALLENDASFFSDLNIASVATGPLTIQFDMYITGTNNPSTDPTTWAAFTLSASGNCWPIVAAGEFGFLARVNGGVITWQNGNPVSSGWDTPGFATNNLWKFIFSDTNGTGSAFSTNGSQVIVMNGTNILGTNTLAQLNSAGLRLGFRSLGNRYAGIANLAISGTQAALSPPGQNLSFEYDLALAGHAATFIPSSWTAFNQNAPGDIGSQNSGGTDYTVFNPLAPPAAGNQFCYVNMFNPSVTGGIYQDFGPLQPNSIYTLTVAIGSRADRNNSPGIISLVNGTDNTGTVLATGGGLPSTQNTWQDYTTTFDTGPSVSGDVTVMLSVLGNGTTIQADFDNVRLSVQASPVPLPIRVQDISPASATVGVGSNVVFTAAFSNSPPVNLQWQQILSGSPPVTNNINSGVVTVTNNGVVSSILTLNNVQLSNAGSYRLKAANATNFVTIVYTGSAPLTVIPTITWYAVGAYNYSFSNNAVLALAGSVANEVYGVDFGGSGLETTANGYTFNDYAASGNMSVSGSTTVFGGYEGSATTGDLNFDTILNNGISGSSASKGTLNNLTPGQTYTVLVLLDDTRTSGASGPNFDITDGITVSPVQRFAYPNGAPAIGGYIMGTFTAQSTNQPLTVLQNGNAQYVAILLEKGIATPPQNPPELTADIHPPVLEVTTGSPVTLPIGAGGTLPLSFQWFNQNGSIGGANSSSYTFNALAGTNNYDVVVTNSYGSVTSSIVTVISAPNIVTVNNFSFEAQVLAPGGVLITTPNGPTGWTGFNVGSGGNWDIGVQNAGGTDYTVNNPLAAPADGNNYCWVNRFNGNGTQVAGVYQDVGPLLANTAYTLTVAIGQRNDTGPAGGWSPGIISLLNGTDNTGTVLATGGGLPATANTWQDFTVTFTNGATASGDLIIDLSVLDGPHIQADFDNVRLTKVSVAPPTAPRLNKPVISVGNLILTGTGGTPNAGYTWLMTTNLSSPIIWTTNTTGTLDGTGAFSNAIPVIASQRASFFRLRLP